MNENENGCGMSMGISISIRSSIKGQIAVASDRHNGERGTFYRPDDMGTPTWNERERREQTSKRGVKGRSINAMG